MTETEQVVLEVKTCKQCGDEFNFTEGEKAFYDGLNYSYPERCEKCRKENKSKKALEKVAEKEVARQLASQNS